MTHPVGSHQPSVGDRPRPDTAVLLRRKLNPSADLTRLSVFAEDRWVLSPGVFEAHTHALSLNFTTVPEPFREQVKHYFWQLINHPAPQALRRGSGQRRSLQSCYYSLRRLSTFVSWLHNRGATSFGEVTSVDLDRFLDSVLESEASRAVKEQALTEVRRLWLYRDRLPRPMRLPSAPPWGGEDTRDLLGGTKRPRENRTPRIHPDTMGPLLLWALRFVEDFADDIIAAFAEYLTLSGRGGNTRDRRRRPQRTIYSRGELSLAVDQHLRHLRQEGRALAGRVTPHGVYEVDWSHLARVFDCNLSAFAAGSRLRELVAKSGIPIADRAYLNAPITGRLHSRPWRQAPIAYDQAEQLARMLSAATFVVISYLSGMRPGEVLNLARGCTHHDPSLGLWLVEGLKWKGAVDDDGNKLPEGQPREDPWTVVPVVARAVSALERLHPHRLLFPAQRLPTRTRGNNTGKTRLGEGRTTVAVAKDLAEFVNRVNDFCVRTGRPDERIPSDPHGGMSTSRFRRTLAWHIVRRPRGLVAGAIQYGHLHVQITLGYAGSYDSGYPDEHAYEEWLYRLETLAEDEGLLGAGEHVSGPAADTYRHRVRAAHARFAGRVLTNTKQAKDMLANPLLQIYPGRAMTCVLDPAKALCQLSGAEGSTRHTPDQHDCRPNCQNIAYTDRDIGQLKTRAQELHKIVDDPLAPSIRHQRERHELDRISGIIRRHEHRGQTT